MKTKVFTAILLLLMALSTIYASEDPTEMTKEQLDKAEIQKFKERFESTLNATGEIKYDTNMTYWSYFKGRFNDIQHIPENDSTYARNIFDNILERMIQFTPIKEQQINKHRIIFSKASISTIYSQSAYGYTVANGGRFNLVYYLSDGKFSIGNSTVEIPEGVPEISITQEQAIKAVYNEQSNSALALDAQRRIKLVYVCNWNENNKIATLCFSVPDKDYNYYVDASSGKIILRLIGTLQTLGGYIKGSIYNTDYGTGVPVLENEDKSMAGVQFSTNEATGYSQANGYFEIEESDFIGLSSILMGTNIIIKDYFTQNTIGSCFEQLPPILFDNITADNYLV